MSIADISERISKGLPIAGGEFIEFMIVCSCTIAETMERIYSSDVEWRDDALEKMSLLFHGDKDFEKYHGDGQRNEAK